MYVVRVISSIIWHRIVYSVLPVPYNVVSLWRSFVTTELVRSTYLSRIEESARTLVLLDVDG